jgi:hypothetical protein
VTEDDKTPTGKRERHWTTNLPLWGIFGAVAACAWLAGQVVADVRRQGAAFVEFAKETRVELTAHHDWIIRHEAQVQHQQDAPARERKRKE